MRILITGATGLVGSRLVQDRLARGDEVIAVSRHPGAAAKILSVGDGGRLRIVGGDPGFPGPWQDEVDGCDAVVHLAGAPVAGQRWTAARKQMMFDSRIDSTFQVVEAIGAAMLPPTVLVSASAIGIYGATGDQPVDEFGAVDSATDFLAELCQQWESVSQAARSASTRVVNVRIGAVLDDRGGLLGSLLPLFRWGLGGPIGSGRQLMSWIHWRDLIGLIDLALRQRNLHGALNAVAPEPVSNGDFSRTLGRVLHRPAFMPMPGAALRVILGELAHYALMNQAVHPGAALGASYAYHYPDLESALVALLDPAARQMADLADGAGPISDVAPSVPDSPVPRHGPPARLIAVGGDGQLLRRDGTVAVAVQRACAAAASAGCVVLPVTAGPPRQLAPVIDALELTGPCVAYAGAVLWSPRDQRALFHQPLDEAALLEAIERIRRVRPDADIAIESLDRWYTDRPMPEASVPPDDIGSLRSFVGPEVSALTVAAEPDAIEAVRAVLGPDLWAAGRIAVFRSSARVLQIVHPQADPAVAVQRVAQRLGCEADAVLALGDGEVDAGMMAWAGFAATIAGSPLAERDLADLVLPAEPHFALLRLVHRYVAVEG